MQTEKSTVPQEDECPNGRIPSKEASSRTLLLRTPSPTNSHSRVPLGRSYLVLRRLVSSPKWTSESSSALPRDLTLTGESRHGTDIRQVRGLGVLPRPVVEFPPRPSRPLFPHRHGTWSDISREPPVSSDVVNVSVVDTGQGWKKRLEQNTV